MMVDSHLIEPNEVFALEIQPGHLPHVMQGLRDINILEVHHLKEVSRLLHNDVAVILTVPGVLTSQLMVPGVIAVEGSAEHIFYMQARPLFPAMAEATHPGIENLTSDEVWEVLRPIPTNDIARDLPLGAPGLFLGPEVPGLSSVEWEEILRAIHARQAWEYGQGEGAIIAVIDTGIDGRRFPADRRLGGWSDHPDLDPWVDPVGHGTMVGMIAAGPRTGGFTGIAPEAGLFSIRLELNSKGAMPTSSLLRGLDQVLQLSREANQRVILNNSWGLYGCKDLILPCNILITRILMAADPLMSFLSVWAVGNNRHLCPDQVTGYCMNTTPASVSVGAVDQSLRSQYYSSAGGQCFPLTPTLVTPTYGQLPWGSGWRDFADQGGGTSSCTPMVSGALAILDRLYPDVSNGELRAALRASAMPLNEHRMYEHYDYLTGSGLLQMKEAIEAVPEARNHPSFAYEQQFTRRVSTIQRVG